MKQIYDTRYRTFRMNLYQINALQEMCPLSYCILQLWKKALCLKQQQRKVIWEKTKNIGDIHDNENKGNIIAENLYEHW